jgi:tetratricopeptide (TPR) repeat protein
MSQSPGAVTIPSPPPQDFEGKPSISKQKRFGICLLLIAVTIGIYFPSTQNSFVNIDDGAYVYANPHVRNGFTWDGIRWSFTAFEKSLWHPLTWFSIMLDTQMFGLKPWGHHLISLLIHAANAALLFLVLERMTKAAWRSAFVAALFALHPVHVESVAWVAERKDVFSAFFWMLTMWAYIAYVREHDHKKRKRLYVLAVALFTCGLLSKPMVVTLPLVLLLMDFWPLRRFQPSTFNLQPSTASSLQNSSSPALRLITEKLPFLAAAFLVGIVTIFAQKSTGALQAIDRLPVGYRIANAVVSYGHYFVQTFWPANLAVYYPYPKHFSFGPVAAVTLAGVAISLAVLWVFRQRPYLALGWFWFLVTLAPVIGLIQVGNQAYADRYMYLPMIGLLIMIAWGVYDLARNIPNPEITLSTAAAVVIFACIVLTRQQIGYWKDSVMLFSHALAVTENNNFAHNNLGTALLDQGQVNEAIPHFQEVVKLTPANQVAQRNLATALFTAGRLDEALPHAMEAVRLNPRDATALSLLGTIWGNKGQPDQAIKFLQEAVKLAPKDFKSRLNLGVALAQKRRFDEAAEQFQEALRLNPNDMMVQKYLRACQSAIAGSRGPSPTPNSGSSPR